jgi:hypothetical protein
MTVAASVQECLAREIGGTQQRPNDRSVRASLIAAWSREICFRLDQKTVLACR